MTYYYGKTVVEVFPMSPAHTYGDLVVYLPRSRIPLPGDIAFFYVAPFCQNARPSNWIGVCETIDKIEDMFDTRMRAGAQANRPARP